MASAGYQDQDSRSQSATDSRKHAISVTRKASARVKQEHKVTISTTTITGASETTTRTLVNPSDTHPMRIDYFSMMRKWKVRVYRYGLRLTYDITIPEPGAALREPFALLDIYQKQAQVQFTFKPPFQYSDLSYDNLVTPGTPAACPYYYRNLENQYSVSLPSPPQDPGPPLQVPAGGGTVPGLGDDDHWHYFNIPVNVPDVLGLHQAMARATLLLSLAQDLGILVTLPTTTILT